LTNYNALEQELFVEIANAQLEAKQSSEKINASLPLELKHREEQLVATFDGHRGNSFSKLQDLYSFMDEIYSFVARFTPCKKGCSFCCNIAVSVSVLEVDYIKMHKRMFRKVVAKESRGSSNPCPFLSKGECSIYDVRPFVCRRHTVLTMTPSWCHLDKCHTIKLPMISFTEIDKVYEQILSESGTQSEIIDIREVLKGKVT